MSKFKTTPYRHQLDDFNANGRKRAWGWLWDMGTGKTWIAINNVADLWASGDLDSVLVFAPNGVHMNWTRLELPKHMPDWCRYKTAPWVAGAKIAERKAIESVLESGDHTELRIFAMNWEALQSKRGQVAAKQFCVSAGSLMIICDESDSIKNPKAARTKALFKLKRFAEWRRIMTGTPINNAPFDAFTQLTFLDENIFGTSSFYAFKAEYAEMLPPMNPLVQNIKQKTRSRGTPQIVATGPGGRPKYRNLDKLSRLMASVSSRVLKEDCLDLPEKIYKTVFFKLTNEQLAVYKKAEEECRLAFEDEDTPFDRLVALGKLAQITSGYYIHPHADEPVRIEGDTPKLDLLINRVKAILAADEQVIIWARYRIEIADIVAALRKENIICAEYHGGTKKCDRIDAIDLFEKGQVPVFVGNQQAGGTGITLVAASYVIYFSNNFSLRDRLQSEDRAHRIGQTKNVTYINIAAQGTVDEDVVAALSDKKDVAELIVDVGRRIA